MFSLSSPFQKTRDFDRWRMCVSWATRPVSSDHPIHVPCTCSHTFYEVYSLWVRETGLSIVLLLTP